MNIVLATEESVKAKQNDEVKKRDLARLVAQKLLAKVISEMKKENQ